MGTHDNLSFVTEDYNFMVPQLERRKSLKASVCVLKKLFFNGNSDTSHKLNHQRTTVLLKADKEKKAGFYLTIMSEA